MNANPHKTTAPVTARLPRKRKSTLAAKSPTGMQLSPVISKPLSLADTFIEISGDEDDGLNMFAWDPTNEMHRKLFLESEFHSKASFDEARLAMRLAVASSSHNRVRLKVMGPKGNTFRKLFTFTKKTDTMFYSRSKGHGAASVEDILKHWENDMPSVKVID